MFYWEDEIRNHQTKDRAKEEIRLRTLKIDSTTFILRNRVFSLKEHIPGTLSSKFPAFYIDLAKPYHKNKRREIYTYVDPFSQKKKIKKKETNLDTEHIKANLVVVWFFYIVCLWYVSNRF